MSGGEFDYLQHRVSYVADHIEKIVANGELPDCKPETIAKILEAAKAIRKAAVYMQRVDWFVSGDDGEDSFIKRLNDDLGKLD